MNFKTVKTTDIVRKKYFSNIKKALLKMEYVLLKIRKIKDRNIKLVSVIDTG